MTGYEGRIQYGKERKMKMRQSSRKETETLEGPFQPTSLARAISWLAFIVATFMAHGNGNNKKGQPRDGNARHAGGNEPLRKFIAFTSF